MIESPEHPREEPPAPEGDGRADAPPAAAAPEASPGLGRMVRRALPWVLLAGAIVIWFAASQSGSELPDGEPAPALAIPWTEAGQFDLESERGNVVVLAFWATWCPACREEGPVLSRVHDRISPRGDRVVGVSVDNAPLDAIFRAAVRLGMRYPIAHATRDDLERFGVELLPTIYVIGPDGRVHESFTGGVGEDAILEAVEDARDARVSAL